MGMFDYLVCEAPLPDGRIVEGAVWQTKDSPCDMGLVKITSGGRLLYEEAHYEDVPEEQRPYYGKPEWKDGSLFQICGMIRRVVDRVVDAEYHGDVRFYRADFDEPWEEYEARFTNGQLQSIRRVDVPANASRP